MPANQMIGVVLVPVPTPHHGLAIVVVEVEEVVERASRFVVLQNLFPLLNPNTFVSVSFFSVMKRDTCRGIAPKLLLVEVAEAVERASRFVVLQYLSP